MRHASKRLNPKKIEEIAAELASDQLSLARLEALRTLNEANSASWEYGMRGIMKHKEGAPGVWRRFEKVRYDSSHPRDPVTGEVKEEDWLKCYIARE